MSYSVGSASSSSGSSGSSKRLSRRYRTINSRSEVDENLFGTPNRLQQAQKIRETKAGSHDLSSSAPTKRTEAKRPENTTREFVKHITKDLIRDILVPKDTETKSCVIDKSTYHRLVKACQSQSKEDYEYEKMQKDQYTEDMMREMNQRKLEFQKYDNMRKKNEELEEIDTQAKEDAEYLLKRANELRSEQEDEIKHLNELILNAKVHAIRDAQISEKGLIKRELRDEDKRLDQMMEAERQKAIKIQEEIERAKKINAKQAANMIIRQIEENKQVKLIDEELKDQENVVMNQFLQQIQKEDFEELQKRKEKQKKLGEALQVANKEMQKQKEIVKQQEIIADLKAHQYQIDKAAKEAAMEAEADKKRMDREKEIARLRALQERAKDLQAEKDALRAKREQERKEREWREKERAEAIKKMQVADEMRQARESQIRNKEHYLAVEAAKDRAEFERVLQNQLQIADKQKMQDDMSKTKLDKYRKDLLNQIGENEGKRIEDRKNFFEEGVKLDEEAKLRRLKLDEIKMNKLNELRRAGIPEKYCAEIEKKVNPVKSVTA